MVYSWWARPAAWAISTLSQLSRYQVETAPPEPIDIAAYRLRRKPILGALTSEYQTAA